MTTILQLTRVLQSRPEPAVPQGIRLRNFAGPDDIDRWLDLRHRAFARQPIGVASWTASDFQREFLEKPWWRPEHVWFAEGRSLLVDVWNPVGTVALAFRGSGPKAKPVVHWLAVLPAWRGRGIGRALMAALEQRCWDCGYRQVCLETHIAWQDAVAMYRALGYTSVVAPAEDNDSLTT